MIRDLIQLSCLTIELMNSSAIELISAHGYIDHDVAVVRIKPIDL
jgi:hypothetical protein